MRRLLTAALTATALVLLSASAQAVPIPIAGMTSGVFKNPAGDANAGPFYTGVGSSLFGWGDPGSFGTGPNSISFAGVPFSSTTETNFLLGQLTYFNGTTTLDTNATSVDLDVSLAFTLPTGITESFTFPLAITTTPNIAGDPVASADILTLPTLFSPETFTYNGVTYQVHLNGFSNPSVDGFITGTGNNMFNVYETGTATADLYGRVTSNVVPEPTSLLLLGTGLVGLVGLGRRRMKK